MSELGARHARSGRRRPTRSLTCRSTAGPTLLGKWVITLDPIFSGLAWAIIFGILTSTIFTLMVVPVVYWLLYARGEEKVSNSL